jgi:hypothetical protein
MSYASGMHLPMVWFSLAHSRDACDILAIPKGRKHMPGSRCGPMGNEIATRDLAAKLGLLKQPRNFLLIPF